MLDFLKKKKGEEESVEDEVEEKKDAEEEKKEEPNKKESAPVSADTSKLTAEIEKIKASLEAFAEVRKSSSERFNRISEQIGELRAMILDRDKNIQSIELKSLKAYDLVETVQPEKIMIDVQKQEAKIEALKANLEGNEAIMDRVMEELKDAKKKIKFFRGVEEIVKLSEETKKELMEIKKVESRININTDKVETIYSEIRKKFQKIDVFDSSLQEMRAGVEQNTKDSQFLKDKVSDLASKDELNALVQKVQRYVEALKDLEKKSSMSKDIDKLKLLLEGLK